MYKKKKTGFSIILIRILLLIIKYSEKGFIQCSIIQKLIRCKKVQLHLNFRLIHCLSFIERRLGRKNSAHLQAVR